MRQFRVLVNGSEYKVAIEELDGSGVTNGTNQPRQQAEPAVQETVVSSAPKVANNKPKPVLSGDSSGIITAAMPGTILDVKVSVGEGVVRGQTLLILEAMKMENEIMAPNDGDIAEISTKVGASVNSGDVLIVMS